MRNLSEHTVLQCDSSSDFKISAILFYSVLSGLGSVLNLAVLLLVLAVKKLRTVGNALIVNGCVSDILLCAFWMPHEAVLLSSGTRLAPVYRDFVDAVLFVAISVSLLSHSLIAIHRYILITKTPATYMSIYQKRHTCWMICGSWLVALCLLPPCASSWETQDGCPTPGTAAWLSRGTVPAPAAAGTLLFMLCAHTSVVVLCYARIFRKARSSWTRVSVLALPLGNVAGAAPRRERRSGVHVLQACVIFLLCTQPQFWVLLIGLITSSPVPFRRGAWLLLCSMFVTSPVVHTYKHEEFRKNFRSVLRGELWIGVSGVTVEPISTVTRMLENRRD